jgi:peptidoglycan/LPS O-acetylase OafA/YrhL
MLCGVGLGYLYARQQQNPAPSVWPVALIGIVAMTAGFCFNKIPFTVYANADYWKTSPNLFLMRMGYVCIILAGLTYLTQRIGLPRRAIQSVAQESLTIYIIHICILYGSTWNLGLRQRIGPTLTFLPTLEWIIFLLASMTLAAWMWNWFKHNEPVKLRWLQSAAVLLIAYSLT